MKRMAIAVVMVLAGSGALMAQSAAIGERQKLMKGFGAATREPGMMLQGKAPFDLAKVQASLKVYADGTTIAPSLFPEDSKTGGDTKALPAVWEQKDKFVASFAKFHADATAAMDSIKDEATFKAEMPKVLGNCGGCHETWRARS